jgi:hypothetical protein
VFAVSDLGVFATRRRRDPRWSPIRRLPSVKLGRRPAQDDVVVVPDEEPLVGKGRPTPKRAAARSARRNATPRNAKEAAELRRQKQRSERQLARQALQSGDEKHLPARDAGPERRLARDVVDSRFTYGQVFFGLIFITFAIALVNNSIAREIGNFGALISLTVMVIDGARNGRKAKTAVAEKYGAKNAVGISSYAFMRALLPRRFRRPPPRVGRGGDPI